MPAGLPEHSGRGAWDAAAPQPSRLWCQRDQSALAADSVIVADQRPEVNWLASGGEYSLPL